MAKKGPVIKIRLVSEENTGYFYVTRKNPRNQPEKMMKRKYDPKLGRHCMFKEAKIK